MRGNDAEARETSGVPRKVWKGIADAGVRMGILTIVGSRREAGGKTAEERREAGGGNIDTSTNLTSTTSRRTQ